MDTLLSQGVSCLQLQYRVCCPCKRLALALISALCLCSRVQNLFHSIQLNVNNPHFLIMQGRITKVQILCRC